MSLKLMFITNNIKVAEIAQDYGVDRIWIDLESLGKEERQKNMNTVKSKHKIEDIKKIKPILKKSELLVRVNPINLNSEKEIEKVIEAGADIIMLPMWKSKEEVELFLAYVNKRVRTTLLLETREGVECLDDILIMGGFDEIHIGLNDLHLSYKLSFMFELLSNGIVEKICKKIQGYNIPFGFGGISKLGDGLLPAEQILIEHYNLKSTRVILSRGFCDVKKIKTEKELRVLFKNNIKELKKYEETIKSSTSTFFLDNKNKINKKINEIIKNK